MDILNFIPSVFRKKLYQALYQYEIHSGTANIVPDDATAYISKGYAGNTAVYAIVSLIENMRRQGSLKLYRKLANNEIEEVSEHELLKYTDKVNDTTYTDDFITAHLVYLLTIGEFFVYAPRLLTGINKGKSSEIFQLPSAEVEIIEGTIFQPVKGYRIEGAYNMMFEPWEVYHSKLFNPLAKEERNLHGLSPLRAASKTVSTLNELELTQLKQLENQGPPYVLYKKIGSTGNSIDAGANRLTDEQRAKYLKEIRQSSSEKTRGLPLILKDEFGKIDLGVSFQNAELKAAYENAVIAICGVYQIPPEIIGYGQKTYNNMTTAVKSAYNNCVIPFSKRVAQTFNACLIDGYEPYKDLFFAFDFSEVEELQEGIETKVNWMIRSRWTGNEIRTATGKTPVDNPLMDEPVIPMGESFLSDYTGEDLTDETMKDFKDYIKQ